MKQNKIESFSLTNDIGKGWSRDENRRDESLKIRFETLLSRAGKSSAQIYKKIGIDKADWSRIIHGISVPPVRLQVAIAKELECDSVVIWGNKESEQDGGVKNA